ncbi:MAG: methyl-accepting chemotaxis protein [Byssovorax sp.]
MAREPVSEQQAKVDTILRQSIFLPLLPLILTALVLFWQVRAASETTEWVDHSNLVITKASEVERLIVQKESSLRGFVITGSPVFVESFDAAEKRLDLAFDELRALVGDNPQQQQRVTETQGLVRRWDEFARDTVQQRKASGSSSPEMFASLALTTARNKGQMDLITRETRAFSATEESLRNLRIRDAGEASRRLIWVGGVLLAFVAAVMVLFTRRQLLSVSSDFGAALQVARSREAAMQESERKLAEKLVAEQQSLRDEAEQRERLTRAVRSYGVFIDRLARGELGATLESEGEGELSQLGMNLEVMGRALRSMTLRIHEAVNSLSSATAEILTTTQQQSSAATESAAAVVETVATVDEVVQTAQQTAERAKQVDAASQRSVEVSAAGREAVALTIESMGRARDQVASIGERILALSEQAQTVGQIITTVNELAEQSNLLALNAAIEAARAGEHGRGFAVVAQEIRVLAEQSKRATTQVRGILGDIQKLTTAAVLATEQGNKAVGSAVDLVRDAGARIDQLAGTIATAAVTAQQIVETAQQQVTGVGQISQATHAIRQAATQTVEGTRQTERAARDLNELSVRLRDAVSQYRT